jgi:pimeloyl-ACP methyl ester carboxylesterase
MAAALLAGFVGHRIDEKADWLPRISFRHQARDVAPGALLRTIGDRRGIDRPIDVAVLVHGLFIDEQNFLLGPDPLADALEPIFGWTPLLVRYNSGKHISDSGRDLADLLHQLHEEWGHRLGRVQLIGHSMGGLVARAALSTLERRNDDVLDHIERLFLLATPNHGAELERLGHLVEASLARLLSLPGRGRALFEGPEKPPRGAIAEALDEVATSAIERLASAAGFPIRTLRGIVELRSHGIRDVRYGYMQEVEWRTDEQMGARYGINHRRPLPPPAGVKTYAVAGSLLPVVGSTPSRIRNDGLVSVASAAAFGGDFDDLGVVSGERFVEVPLLAHQLVPSSERVRARMRDWIDADPRKAHR